MMERNDSRPALWMRLIGLLILSIGLVGLYYGPLEIYCFYMFSPGGVLEMTNFDIGTLMFTYLAIQNMGYYAVAALALPMGIGIIRGRAWARRLGVAACVLWLILGTTLLVEYAVLLPYLRDSIELGTLLLSGAGVLVLGLLIPLALIGVLHLPSVERNLENNGKNGQAGLGIAALTAICLNVIGTLVIHGAVFARGAVPAFGEWISGREGVYILSGLFVVLVVLIWGQAEGKFWASLANLLAWGAAGASLGMTVWGQSLSDLLIAIGFGSQEMNELLLQADTLWNMPMTPLLLVPFASMLVLQIWGMYERRQARRRAQAAQVRRLRG